MVCISFRVLQHQLGDLPHRRRQVGQLAGDRCRRLPPCDVAMGTVSTITPHARAPCRRRVVPRPADRSGHRARESAEPAGRVADQHPLDQFGRTGRDQPGHKAVGQVGQPRHPAVSDVAGAPGDVATEQDPLCGAALSSFTADNPAPPSRARIWSAPSRHNRDRSRPRPISACRPGSGLRSMWASATASAGTPRLTEQGQHLEGGAAVLQVHHHRSAGPVRARPTASSTRCSNGLIDQ